MIDKKGPEDRPEKNEHKRDKKQVRRYVLGQYPGHDDKSQEKEQAHDNNIHHRGTDDEQQCIDFLIHLFVLLPEQEMI